MEKEETRSQFKELRKILKKQLSKSRYEHILGVEFTSAALAMRYGENLYHAELAGLMHDCAKCLSAGELISECSKYDIPISPAEMANPYLLHGKLGAYYCKQRYGIAEKGVLSAIAYHTTGKPAMSMLEKIVYVADYIEPRRDKAPNLADIRKISFVDIDEAVYQIAKDTLDYLDAEVKSGANKNGIDSLTRDTYHYYKSIHCAKKETE